MMEGIELIVVIGIAYIIAAAIVLSTFIYKSRVKKRLIQLSQALESHISGKPIQPFSELEDELLSKIQKQLLCLDDLWTKHYVHEKKEKERLNSLISDIAHQIKTPLANIKLYESLLSTGELSEGEKTEFSKKKGEQVHKLEWLMESLVKVSKMETGIIQINKKIRPLSRILLNAIDMVAPKAENKGIDIIYSLPKDVKVKVDGKWMEEALFNLLDNAVKYSDTGRNIIISAEVLELFVRIDIEDEATIISPKEYNNIFKRFYRIADTAEADGVGVGLYMTRDIVTRHDGYIIVEEGKVGNRFSVFLML